MGYGRILEKTVGVRAVSHQRFHFVAQCAVIATSFANKSAALGGTSFQRERENFLYLLPSLRHSNPRAVSQVRVPARLLPRSNFVSRWRARFPGRRPSLQCSARRKNAVPRGALAVNRSRLTA